MCAKRYSFQRIKNYFDPIPQTFFNAKNRVPPTLGRVLESASLYVVAFFRDEK